MLTSGWIPDRGHPPLANPGWEGSFWILFWLVVLIILKNMSSSMGRISHTLWKNKKHVPNHQPVLGPRPVNRCLEMQTPRKKYNFNPTDYTDTWPSLPKILMASATIFHFAGTKYSKCSPPESPVPASMASWGCCKNSVIDWSYPKNELLLTWSQFREFQQNRFRCSRFLAASGLVPTEIPCSWPHLPQKDAWEACDTRWASGLVNCRPPAWAHWPCDFGTRG